jgi:hypothetical protein
MLDPITLSSITAAVSVLGTEVAKGMASEAAKTAWEGVKKLFGWTSDPPTHEIPMQIAKAAEASPEIVGKLLELLKRNQTGTATQLVGNLEVQAGGMVPRGTRSIGPGKDGGQIPQSEPMLFKTPHSLAKTPPSAGYSQDPRRAFD